MHLFLCVICFRWSPDWAIWPNYEVVESQSLSGISTVLDSFTSITTILAPPASPVSAGFLDCYISLLHPTAPPSSSICRYITSLSVTPTPHRLSWCVTFPTWTLPTPATCHPPTLVSAPRAACLHLPLCPAYIRPPFVALYLLPFPCWYLEGYPVVGTSVTLVSPPSPSLCDSPASVIF